MLLRPTPPLPITVMFMTGIVDPWSEFQVRLGGMNGPLAKLLIVVAAVVAVGLTSCASTGSSSGDSKSLGPAAQAESFERALARGDCPAVKKIVVAPHEIECGSIAEAAQSMKQIDLEAISYQLTDSSKDAATVRLDIGGEKADLELVKADGEWFVLFDTAA